MSLKTICFLTLLIVSCAFSKSIGNLKQKFLSKTSTKLPTTEILTQVNSLAKSKSTSSSKAEQVRRECDPEQFSPPPQAPAQLLNVSSIAVGGTPPEGCVWIFMHCLNAQASVSVNGVYQLCQNMPDSTAHTLNDLTNRSSISGNTFQNNISGIQVGPNTYAKVFRGINYTQEHFYTQQHTWQNICAVTTSNLSWNDKPNSIQIGTEYIDKNGNVTGDVTSVSAIATLKAPIKGCVWMYLNCGVAASVSAGSEGVFQYCGKKILNLSSFNRYWVPDSNDFTDLGGPVWHQLVNDYTHDLSGLRLGSNTSATMYRWDYSVDTGENQLLPTTAGLPDFFCGTGAVFTPYNDKVHWIQLYYI